MKKTLLRIVGLFWWIYALGFSYFGVAGFIAQAVDLGFREALCGTDGCTTFTFIGSITWLIGMVLIAYVPAILISIAWFRVGKQQKDVE